jgi:hypothetical protein
MRPVLPLLLVALAAAPANSPSTPGGGRAPALHLTAPPAHELTAPFAQESWDEPESSADEERQPRLRLTAWGGEAFDSGGSGHGSTTVGGEAAWAFDSLDVGVWGAGYREIVGATREWTPVVLARVTQRFRLRTGVEAAFGFGFGAGRPRGWDAWFQVALGVRIPLGPLFVAGEIAFEERQLLRLGAGLGVALF